MAERVLQALSEIAAHHHDGRVLVITSGPIRAAQARLRGVEQADARRIIRTVEDCALVELVIREGVFGDGADARLAKPS
jgi:broad specificity phosphatase PhoE